jgi:ribosomal-protein-alanine N-acetyltransferase
VREADRAGFAIMKYGDDEAHLLLLAIEPAHRRHGIGSALVEWLERSAQVAGIGRVTLEARASNEAARAFYRRLGYSQAQVLPGYYGGRETSVRMTKAFGLSRSGAL